MVLLWTLDWRCNDRNSAYHTPPSHSLPYDVIELEEAPMVLVSPWREKRERRMTLKLASHWKGRPLSCLSTIHLRGRCILSGLTLSSYIHRHHFHSPSWLCVDSHSPCGQPIYIYSWMTLRQRFLIIPYVVRTAFRPCFLISVSKRATTWVEWPKDSPKCYPRVQA